MKPEIRTGQIWRHFKGGVYRVLYLAYHTNTAEELVIYTSDDGGDAVWARPAYMWLETVERDGKSQPRFELIFDPSSKEAPAKDTNVPDKNADLGKMVPTVDRLADILSHYFLIGDSYTFELTRDKQAFAIGTMTFEDFSEWDDENVNDLAEYIVRKLLESGEARDEV